LKKLLAIILAVVLFTFSLTSPAFAAKKCKLDDSYPTGNAVKGAKTFDKKCATCHAGGKNTQNKKKTLLKDDLVKYEMFDATKIIAQMKCGSQNKKMPAIGKKFKSDKLADVAAYVLEQAEKGWK